MINETRSDVLARLVPAVSAITGVVALSLGGSSGSKLSDHESDLDVYVFWMPPLPSSAERSAQLAAVADDGSLRVDVHSWGLEDHLHVGGTKIELVYTHLGDLQAHIERAYGEGLRDEGYTTSLLHTVASGQPLHDPGGVLTAIRARLRAEFPDPTRRYVLRYHPPLLRFYLAHIAQAQRRGDLLFVQHRRYTVQMMFFNMLFALNRVYNPGEKRLLTHVDRCAIQPPRTGERWLATTRLTADDPSLPAELESLVDNLITLIEQDGGVEIANYPF
jgi:hypothetical protein